MPNKQKIRSEVKNKTCYERTIAKNGKWRGVPAEKYKKYQKSKVSKI